MLTAIITLPENFTSDISGYIGEMFTDLSPYITLLIGVTLAIIVIGAVIGFLHHR